MRASRAADDWWGVWVAGVTSRTILDGRHWLFYLARIESAYESHADLWASTKATVRRAKAAHVHYLGDIYQPKSPSATDADRYSPGRYVSPHLHAHRWQDEEGRHEGWHNDISYFHSDKYGQPPLLAADPRHTFLWPEPMIYFAGHHCRNYLKWSSLEEFLTMLREVRP